MIANNRCLNSARIQQNSSNECNAVCVDEIQIGSKTNQKMTEKNTDFAPQEFMVGECAAMRDIFHRIRRLAATDAPVLISGETGTGKELAALAIHQRSSRANGQFIAINCAALPPSLISSELFGYEKGAFTGATTRKIGLIEQANNGTLFLDEIGDLPSSLLKNLRNLILCFLI